jgi:hypothetical protein
MDWAIIFMLVILKLPILYLVGVVWWAIKSEPRPEDGAELLVDQPEPGSPWTWWRRSQRVRPLRDGPHSSPSRRPGPARTATASAKAERK